MDPAKLKYTKDHEWVAVEGDIATIGITDYAQQELGEITYVEFPEEGQEIKSGDVMCTIESVKAASEIYAPLTGAIAAVNTDLDDQPEKVNEDAFGEGWLCKMRMADSAEADTLMDLAAYDELKSK